MIDIKGEELIERYLYAVFTRLPKKTRVEIDKELRALISDMIMERFGEEMVSEDDIRELLKELGTPSELSEKYYPEAKRSLIGSRYYQCYVNCCKIGMLTTVIGVIVAHTVRILFGNIRYDIWTEMYDVLQALFFSSFAVVTVFTVVFAILDKFNITFKNRKEIERLPTILDKSEWVSTSRCVLHICIISIMTLFLCFLPQLIGILVVRNGAIKVVPLFNVKYILEFRIAWIVIMLIVVFREIIKCKEHVYTFKVAMTTLAVDFVCWILLSVVFSNSSVWNPAFLQTLFDVDFRNKIHMSFLEINLVYSSVSVVFIMLIYVIIIINSFKKTISYLHKNKY